LEKNRTITTGVGHLTARSAKPGLEVDRVVGRNRKAQYRYHLVARFEAGIVLSGSEVKSLREGRVGFEDAHAIIRDGEVFLRALHIPPYDKARGGGHDPVAERKLLLNRGEIRKIQARVNEKGMTLIPTMVYFKGGWAKVELALAAGKRKYDKRKAIMEREQKRELDRFKKVRRGVIGR
jgi:SsrA-binding protein